MEEYGIGRHAERATSLQLIIIRVALLYCVGSLGAVILVLENGPGWEPEAVEGIQPLTYIFLALVAVAVSAAVVMKRRQVVTRAWGERVIHAIIGWAICEFTALFGGIYWLLTGDVSLYSMGVLLLLVAMVLLTPRRSDVVT